LKFRRVLFRSLYTDNLFPQSSIISRMKGTLDRLTFIAEMIELCGKRFPVSRRVLKTCYTGLNLYDAMRRFRSDDVVTLDGVRCSGAAHDGCQKACLIFWREAWLRKVGPLAVQSKVDPDGRAR